MTQLNWEPDLVGENYLSTVLELGTDPDGECEIIAVLVRRVPPATDTPRSAVLHLHGFSDYFFQNGLADFYAARGMAFFGLDLRKSGRARRAGQTPRYGSDLAQYHDELERSLAIIADAHPGLPVTVLANSTGGLITPLWLDRRRAAGRVAPVAAFVLNSPWFDLRGKPAQRGPMTQALRLLAKAQPMRALPLPLGVYGETLHTSRSGEWDVNLDFKPIDGFPVTVGWASCLGGETTIVSIDDGRHGRHIQKHAAKGGGGSPSAACSALPGLWSQRGVAPLVNVETEANTRAT